MSYDTSQDVGQDMNQDITRSSANTEPQLLLESGPMMLRDGILEVCYDSLAASV